MNNNSAFNTILSCDSWLVVGESSELIAWIWPAYSEAAPLSVMLCPFLFWLFTSKHPTVPFIKSSNDTRNVRSICWKSGKLTEQHIVSLWEQLCVSSGVVFSSFVSWLHGLLWFLVYRIELFACGLCESRRLMQKKNKIIWKWILLAKVKLHLGGFYLKGLLI